jgi:hypothetical protein
MGREHTHDRERERERPPAAPPPPLPSTPTQSLAGTPPCVRLQRSTFNGLWGDHRPVRPGGVGLAVGPTCEMPPSATTALVPTTLLLPPGRSGTAQLAKE